MTQREPEMNTPMFLERPLATFLGEINSLPASEKAPLLADFILEKLKSLSPSEKAYFVEQIEFRSTEHLGDDALVGSGIAAAELGVEESTLAVWRCTGRYHLPYVKVGRLVKYRVGDLRDFKRSRRVNTSSDSA